LKLYSLTQNSKYLTEDEINKLTTWKFNKI